MRSGYAWQTDQNGIAFVGMGDQLTIRSDTRRGICYYIADSGWCLSVDFVEKGDKHE